MPQGLNVIHPMNGRFQMTHQDTPDFTGVRWIRRHYRVGDNGDPGGMKGDSGNVSLHLLMDDAHDRGVKGHTDSQESGPVPHLFQSVTKVPDHIGLAAHNNLAR